MIARFGSADPKRFRQVVANDLGETTNASAAAGDALFLRTDAAL